MVVVTQVMLSMLLFHVLLSRGMHMELTSRLWLAGDLLCYNKY